MKLVKKEEELWNQDSDQEAFPKLSSGDEASSESQLATRHLAFEKNYPKNIFIPLIEHLNEMGLQRQYEECVGTRESFQGKNVVSLAEIHKVLSQGWFGERINLVALASNMSNKILMNSKIKKKLFHLLLIRELFFIPRQDPREFKKLVSKQANEVAHCKLPNDPLFSFPSALIYLLSLFTQGLSGQQNLERDRGFQEMLASDDKSKKFFNNQEILSEKQSKQKDISSKEEYKYYISKIITALNSFQREPTELFDRLEDLKNIISQREEELRNKYQLPAFVPEWSYFGTIVINNCFASKRNKQKLTFSLLNQWIQEFKEKSTSLKGFQDLSGPEEEHRFRPIVLISPPL